MPGGNGKGPMGRGDATGRGLGSGGGMGFRRAGVRGRMGGGYAGPGGECVCPACGNALPHRVGQPCNEMSCPNCGTRMNRR